MALLKVTVLTELYTAATSLQQDAQVTLSRPLMTHHLHQKGEKPTFLLNTCTSGNLSYTQSP